MLQIDTYLHASTLEEAYQTLQSVTDSVILGGCGYIRLSGRRISTAIDLSGLGLNRVERSEGSMRIGAMTTLRQLETEQLLSGFASGVLAQSVEQIVGVQLRNSVTIGGSVAGRYPFSDPITALLALDASVELYNHGIITLTDFLERRNMRDIIEHIILPDDGRKAAFISVRKSSTDYAVLNCAVARLGDEYRVVVGSRPGKAVRATEVEDYLKTHPLNEDNSREAGRIGAATLQFGDNPRGSAEYRRVICPVLIKRALMEVEHAA